MFDELNASVAKNAQETESRRQEQANITDQPTRNQEQYDPYKNSNNPVPEIQMGNSNDGGNGDNGALRAGSASNTKCCCCYFGRKSLIALMWISGVAGLIFFTAGSTLIPIGAVQQVKANKLDSELDFTVISPTCEILKPIFIKSNQIWCEDRNNKHPCGCDDIYNYIFLAPQLAEIEYYAGRGDGGYQFESRDVGIERGVNRCTDGDVSPPKWVEGEEATCWRPSDPSVVAEQYRCGNTDCIKIFDPQLDIEFAMGVAKAFWLGGCVIVILSFVFCILSNVYRKKQAVIP